MRATNQITRMNNGAFQNKNKRPQRLLGEGGPLKEVAAIVAKSRTQFYFLQRFWQCVGGVTRCNDTTKFQFLNHFILYCLLKVLGSKTNAKTSQPRPQGQEERPWERGWKRQTLGRRSDTLLRLSFQLRLGLAVYIVKFSPKQPEKLGGTVVR